MLKRPRSASIAEAAVARDGHEVVKRRGRKARFARERLDPPQTQRKSMAWYGGVITHNKREALEKYVVRAKARELSRTQNEALKRVLDSNEVAAESSKSEVIFAWSDDDESDNEQDNFGVGKQQQSITASARPARLGLGAKYVPHNPELALRVRDSSKLERLIHRQSRKVDLQSDDVKEDHRIIDPSDSEEESRTSAFKSKRIFIEQSATTTRGERDQGIKGEENNKSKEKQKKKKKKKKKARVQRKDHEEDGLQLANALKGGPPHHSVEEETNPQGSEAAKSGSITEADLGQIVLRNDAQPSSSPIPIVDIKKGRKKKRKRKKTRSRQKNLRRDNRPKHLKPTYLTPGSSDYEPNRARSKNRRTGNNEKSSCAEGEPGSSVAPEDDNDSFFNSAENQVWS